MTSLMCLLYCFNIAGEIKVPFEDNLKVRITTSQISLLIAFAPTPGPLGCRVGAKTNMLLHAPLV